MDDDVKNASLKAQIAALQDKIENKRQQQIQTPHQRPLPPSRGKPRWSPYGVAPHRGRGGYGPQIGNHQLVLNRTDSPRSHVENGNLDPPTDFVSPRPHQLISKDALERRQKQEADKSHRELVIEGIRFKLNESGSKLTRIPGESFLISRRLRR